MYNCSKYLYATLNTLINTTTKNKEIICINDGSTDDSLNILLYFSKCYPSIIKVIDLHENLGVSTARNVGLDVASGKYIAFCDADDLVSINMYEDYIKLMEDTNIPVCSGLNMRIKDDENLDLNTFTSINCPAILKDMNIDYNFWGETEAVWDKVYLHSFIDGITFLEGCIYEDIAFSYIVLLKSNKIINVNRVDYKYRKRTGSIMNSNVLMNDLLRVCDYTIKQAYKFNLSKEKIAILEDKLKIKIYEKLMYLSEDKLPSILNEIQNIIPSFNTSNTTYAEPFLEYYQDKLCKVLKKY